MADIINSLNTDVMKNKNNISNFTVTNRSPQPRVDIYRLGEISLNHILSLGASITDESNNLLSYSYTRNMDETKSKFNLRIKDQSTILRNGSNKNIFDTVQMFDIVYIYKVAKETPDFIGIIHNKQISATMGNDGKVHKEISISGNSIVSLYSEFNINLSVIGTYATSTDAANFNLKNNFFTVSKDNTTGQIKFEAKNMDAVVNEIWNNFSGYSDILANVSNTNLLTIINSSEIGMSIDCESIPCKFPLSTNLYTDGEMNFIQMLRAIFPQGAYEIFEQPRKLVIRERPFCKEKWYNLKTYSIDINYLTEFDFNQNDNEVYSVFMADVEGMAAIETRLNYKKKSATKEGFIGVETNTENLKNYGYRLCNINFLGYVQDPKITDDKTLLDNLDKELKEMYENNHKMLNGRIKLIDQFSGETPTIGDKLDFTISYNKTVQTTSFYINSETHSWNYGGSMTVEYNVSRGAVYNADGSFQKTPEYFSTALINEILKSQR